MKTNSQEAMIVAWDEAIEGLRENQADLPYVKELGVELEAILENVQDLRFRKQRLRDEAQRNTQELITVLARGNDLLSRIGSGVRSRYGVHSEKLEEFGMKARQRRGRKEGAAVVG